MYHTCVLTAVTTKALINSSNVTHTGTIHNKFHQTYVIVGRYSPIRILKTFLYKKYYVLYFLVCV